MAEAIAAFQSQLSGVMETVFKAAMYEVTRLVEDSFLEEITRCKEQVDTLKKRLKSSESRRKQREADYNNQGCANCGRGELSRVTAVQTDTSIKHENGESEDVNSPQTTDGETQEVKASPKAAKSPCAQSKRLNKGKTTKSSDVYPDSNEKEDSSFEESNVPGSSHHSSDSKYHLNWEAGFDHKSESEQNAKDSSTDPLFQNRYGDNNLDDFNNTGYDATNMTHITVRGDSLMYMAQYEDGAKSGERADQQTYHKDNSGAWSLPRTQMDISGEYDCMLINEEGHLQDPSVIYPDHIDSGSQHNVSDQTNHTDSMTLEGTENMYGESNAISDISHVVDMMQHQFMGKGGRRHTCNLCLATFSDSVSLKAHKQTHRQDSGGGLPYLCNQRRKTVTRACNLKAYEKIHSGQGPQLCSQCSTSFPSVFELQKHKCAQRGDKPYCCQVCGNKFSRLWNLKLHQRIHTQEKPHHCSMCDKSFTRADILKVHLRTHTGERPYCCLVCGLSFKRLDHLKSHQRKHMTDQ